MLLMITAVLVLIPALAILYPFIRNKETSSMDDKDRSVDTDMLRKLDVALEGLNNTELEFELGNISLEDYEWRRELYMTDAAYLMKILEMDESQKVTLFETGGGLKNEQADSDL